MNTYTGTINYGTGYSPTGGQGIYGAVPGQIPLPPSTWQETMTADPALSGQMDSYNSLIDSQLAGQISPSTLRNIGDYSAARGVSLGQPNSPLSNMIGMNLVGTTTEQLQQQGGQNLSSLMSQVGGMQLNPSLAYSVADRNAAMAAAPDPTQAGQHAEQLALQYMRPQGYGGYSGGGRGGYGGSNPFAGMGFNTQDGFNYAGQQGGFSSGIGNVITTGGGFGGYQPLDLGGASYDTVGINPDTTQYPGYGGSVGGDWGGGIYGVGIDGVI